MRGAPKAPVTALWNKSRKHLDVFMTDSQGVVWSSWWEAAPGWQYWFQIHPEQKAAPGAKVSASWAAYDENHLDLFMTASDGTVWSCYWTAKSGWVAWFSIFPAQKMAPGAPVTMLWAAYSKDHLDIFATGADGTVWSTLWTNKLGWTQWFSINPEQKANPGAEVSAVWAKYSNEHLDLFMTDATGVVWSTFWENTKSWNRGWFSIFPGTKMTPGATVAALWAPYGGNHLDIFATDNEGVVWSSFWASGVPWQQWFTVTGPHHFAKGAPITARWAPYSNQHLDLFCTGNDGVVWSTYWDGPKGWQPWFAINSAQKAAVGSEVTAVWSPIVTNHLDLFTTGRDGIFWSNWWEGPTGWAAWFHIPKQFPWRRGPLLNRDPDQVADGYGGGGRWYPSAITLNDGSIFMLTGHPIIWSFTGSGQQQANVDGRHNNTKPEVMNPTGTAVSLINKALGQSGVHDFAPFYPRMFTMPHTGNVFIAQPLYSSAVKLFSQGGTASLGTSNEADVDPPYTNVMDNSMFYDQKAENVTATFPGPQNIDPMYLDPYFTSQETTGVLLPLLHEENYAPRVLLAGASQPLIADLTVGVGITNSWTPTSPRQLIDPVTKKPPVRNFTTATLLPTGDVAITGGVLKTNPYTESPTDTTSGGVRQVEIYHTATGTWSTGATATEVRGYHSSALLTPDGTIWTAGSEIEQLSLTSKPLGTALPKLAIELYKPAYFAQPDRLRILNAPDFVQYGFNFLVTCAADAETVKGRTVSRVALMRFGSCTHSFDGDQRFVSVPFTQNGAELTVTGPPDGTVAPPGYYMLWLLDGDNLPCQHAWTVRLEQREFLRPIPLPLEGGEKENLKGMIEGREVSVKMRKPTEREKIGGGWRLRGRGMGGCGEK